MENNKHPFCYEGGKLVRQLPRMPLQTDNECNDNGGYIQEVYGQMMKDWQAECARIRSEGPEYPCEGFKGGDRDLYEGKDFEVITMFKNPEGELFRQNEIFPHRLERWPKVKVAVAIARPLAVPITEEKEESKEPINIDLWDDFITEFQEWFFQPMDIRSCGDFIEDMVKKGYAISRK